MPKQAKDGKKGGKKRRRFNWVRFMLIVTVCVVLLLLTTTGAIMASAMVGMPNFDPDQLRQRSATTFVYDRNEELWTEMHAEEHRVPVELSEVPFQLRNAVIATEDHRFYSHIGIDLRAIGRAAYRIVTGESFEGASTLTQQLAKNVFLEPDVSVRRKIQEAILALQIERSYSKDEILEMYLNEVHFGHGADGVQTASELYFGKDVSELDLSESALLAGIIRSPSNFSPYNDEAAARQRRDMVLDQMAEYEFITPQEAEEARSREIELAGRTSAEHSAPYFLDYVVNSLVEDLRGHYGSESEVFDAIYRGGLHIYTTKDPGLQAHAEEIMAQGLPEGELDSEEVRQPQGALVSMQTDTGQVLALVGGRDYESSRFNRSTQAKRQPGSAFKPFVYTAALENGFTPASAFVDEPTTIDLPGGGTWSPKNYNHQYSGPTTMRRAIERSINVVAAQTAVDVGIDRVVDKAENMGIRTFVRSGNSNDLQPAVSLGGMTEGAKPIEMAVAYGSLGNQGKRVSPVAVTRVEDRDGNTIWQGNPNSTQVVSPEVAFLMTDMMKGVITAPGGTGSAASIGQPAAGKTGTTSNHTDVWFVGYTPSVVTSVWVGADDRGESDYMQRNRVGSSLPAGLWGNFMNRAAEEYPGGDFSQPGNVVGPIQICVSTGLLAGPGCPDTYAEYFVSGTQPTRKCTGHAVQEQEPEPQEEEEEEEENGDEDNGNGNDNGEGPNGNGGNSGNNGNQQDQNSEDRRREERETQGEAAQKKKEPEKPEE